MFASWKNKANGADTSKTAPPLERITILTNQEASDRIDQQEAMAATAAKNERKRKLPHAKPAEQPRAPTPGTPAQPAEMSASDRAMQRMQRDQMNMYMRRHQNNMQWLLLAKKLQQSVANTVIAEAASDLSKAGTH